MSAGYCLASANRLQFWLTLATLAGCQLALSIAVGTWAGQYEWKMQASPGSQQWDYFATYRPWTDVLRDWFADGGTPVRALAANTLLLMLIWYLVAGTLLLPRIHPGVRAWRSLEIAGRVVVAAAGPAILFAGAFQVLSTLQYHWEMEWMKAAYNRGPESDSVQHPPYPNVFSHSLIAIVRWLLLPALVYYLSFAARGARCAIEWPERILHCEECGYELAHQSDFGRCTECGTALVRSVHPQFARPGTPWEIRPSIITWLTTSILAAFHPFRLFRATRARETDFASTVFSFIHYSIIGLFLFLAFRYASHLPNYFDVFVPWTQTQYFEPWNAWSQPTYRALMKTGASLVALWTFHRGFGLLMVFVGTTFGWVPPGTLLAKLIDYQVVFLWLVLVIGGPWMTMTGMDSLNGIYAMLTNPGPSAMSQLELFLSFQLGIARPLSSYLVVAFYAGPPLLLASLWARRYAMAFRAISRANF